MSSLLVLMFPTPKSLQIERRLSALSMSQGIFDTGFDMVRGEQRAAMPQYSDHVFLSLHLVT